MFGDLYLQRGSLKRAGNFYEQALEIGKRLANREPENVGWQRDVSVSLERLGEMLSEQGNLEGARRAYEQALGMRQQLAEKEPENLGWQRDVSVSLGLLGGLLHRQGKLEEARRAYEQALEGDESELAADARRARMVAGVALIPCAPRVSNSGKTDGFWGPPTGPGPAGPLFGNVGGFGRKKSRHFRTVTPTGRPRGLWSRQLKVRQFHSRLPP